MPNSKFFWFRPKGGKRPGVEVNFKLNIGKQQKRTKEPAPSLLEDPVERPIANQPVLLQEPVPAANNNWGIVRGKTTASRNGAKERRVEDPAPERVVHPGSGFPVDRSAMGANPTNHAYPNEPYANEANEAYANEAYADEAYADEPYANEAKEAYANEPYANEPYPNVPYANVPYTQKASGLADQLNATHLTASREREGEPAMPHQPPVRERVNERISRLPGGFPESDRDPVREQYKAREFQTRCPSLTQTLIQTQARRQPVPRVPPIGLQRGIPQPTAASPVASRSNVPQPAPARPASRFHPADEIMAAVNIPKQVQVPASVVAGMSQSDACAAAAAYVANISTAHSRRKGEIMVPVNTLQPVQVPVSIIAGKSHADACAAAAAYTGTTATPAAPSMASYTVHDEEEYQWRMQEGVAASLAGTQPSRASSRASAASAYGNVPWPEHTTGRGHSTTSSTSQRTRIKVNPALEDPRISDAEAVRIRDPIQLPSRSSHVNRPTTGVGGMDWSEHAAAPLSPGRSSFPNRGLLPGFDHPMNNRRNTTGPQHQADIYMMGDSTDSRYGDDPVIKLRVWGSDDPGVNVHLSKLRSSSRKFRKLNENSMQQHGYVDADGDFYVVRAYVNWLYEDKIPIAGFERSVNSRTESTMDFLVELYGYAWRIWDVKFMNDVTSGLIHTIREADWVPNAAIVAKVYEKTHREKGRDGPYRKPPSKLRLLMIDVWIWQESGHPRLNGELNSTPRRFQHGVVENRWHLPRMSRPRWVTDPQSYLHD